MSAELDAAGITNGELRSSYLECRRLNAEHGKTYFLATRLLPLAKRPYVHALYGFARYADEIVDDLSSTLTPEEKRQWLTTWSAGILNDIEAGRSSDAIGMALIDTIKRWQIPHHYFKAFLHSMAMDLTISEYKTYEALSEYVYGSAAVIGLEMVHILGVAEPHLFEETLLGAKKLGIAFQLANFIRDVGEDLERGRIYLPLDELQQFNIDKERLKTRRVDSDLKAALAFQINRVRELQREAEITIKNLSPESHGCIKAASELYCGIVDEVEKIDFQVFTKRAKTSTYRRLKVALPAWWQMRQASKSRS
ncbi:MAG: phytoene/squalene synthase family protein [Candidatus Nanopelagicaceae bacterium]